MTTPAAASQLEVEITGSMSPEERRYTTERIGSLATYSHKPVLHAHVTVEYPRHAAADQRADVSATFDVSGRTVTATATGATTREAVDALRQRMQTRLSRQRRGRARVYAWVSGASRRS